MGVDTQWGVNEPVGEVNEFGLVVDAMVTPERVARDLEGMYVFVVLDDVGRFRADPALPSIGRDGQLLAVVGAAGELDFTAMEAGERSAYLDGVDSLREVKSVAND